MFTVKSKNINSLTVNLTKCDEKWKQQAKLMESYSVNEAKDESSLVYVKEEDAG
jgi:hypothetical protein